MHELPTYPCWFTDSARSRFVDVQAPEACPILVRALLADESLFNHKCGSFKPVPNMQARVIVEHCRGCNCFVVKDGNHRLLWWARHEPERTLLVVEISAPAWPLARQDMKTLHRFRATHGQPACRAGSAEILENNRHNE